MHKLNIGYGTNGSITDRKVLADGTEAITRDAATLQVEPMIRHFQKDHNTFRLVKDKIDKYSIAKFGKDAFSYNQDVRYNTFINWKELDFSEFGNLDLVIWEWRWQIPGRNSFEDIGKPYFQDDYVNQCKFFEFFSQHNIPVFVFDQDYKLTADDLKKYPCIKGVLDYGTKWINQSDIGIYTDCCLDTDYFNMYQPRSDVYNYCMYIGNRYERDWCADKYFADNIHVYGNWLDHNYDSKERWPNAVFGSRVQPYQFYELYSRALGVPLLAKESYCYHGFMTLRLGEAVLYGALPLFIEEFNANYRFCPQGLRKYLYINDNKYNDRLAKLTYEDRVDIISTLREHLKFIDAKNTVDIILDAYSKLV